MFKHRAMFKHEISDNLFPKKCNWLQFYFQKVLTADLKMGTQNKQSQSSC